MYWRYKIPIIELTTGAMGLHKKHPVYSGIARFEVGQEPILYVGDIPKSETRIQARIKFPNGDAIEGMFLFLDCKEEETTHFTFSLGRGSDPRNWFQVDDGNAYMIFHVWNNVFAKTTKKLLALPAPPELSPEEKKLKRETRNKALKK